MSASHLVGRRWSNSVGCRTRVPQSATVCIRQLDTQEGSGGDDGILWITGGGEVVTFHRQNQVRQLKDTWPIECFCTYKYQLATQVDGRQVHPSHRFGQNLITSPACDYLNTRKSDNLADCEIRFVFLALVGE